MTDHDPNLMTEAEDPKPQTSDVAAIVLAAGRSQRMGAFKPLLPFGSTTVIENCIENLRGGGVETIVVVLGQGRNAEELKNHLTNARISFAVNPDPHSQMSASIACGLRQVPETTRAVLINPADHAAVPAEVVAALIREWRQGGQLVKPIWSERGGHPVLVDLSFRNELLALDPNGGLKAFFSLHQDQVRRVPVHSNFIARDMNTWDDYAALHQDVFGTPPPEHVRPDVGKTE
jgi:molybdenum cofactor cytidylyltransferase